MDKAYVFSLPSIWVVMVIILIGFSNADLEKDRAQCTDQLIGLATCLPYVGGDAKAPTLDCCSGLKLVLQKSRICLCILIKDRDDPNLGLKINATIALGLPAKCNSPTNISDCVSLLKLAPGSPDAKVFEDFSNKEKNNGTATALTGTGNNANTSTAAIKSASGIRRRKWLGVEMVLSLLVFVSVQIFPTL